jgi:CubicO group peptidase (beta-lactamase class C family)
MKNKGIVIFQLMIFFTLCSHIMWGQSLNSKEVTERSIDNYMKPLSGNTPGAVVAVIINGELQFNKAYGLANVEDSIIMTNDKLFNFAGLSKTFTTYAVLKLVEKNKISLEDNIGDIFKDFPEYGKKVKIINLLNHTSGLKSYDPQIIKTNDDVLDFLFQQDSLNYKPGTKWLYSNSDYPLLVKIVEKKSRKSFKKFLKKYLFDEIIMNNTVLAEDINFNLNIAKGYYNIDSSFKVAKNVSTVYGEQGIYTNSLDYVKWDNAFFNYILLSESSVQQFFDPIQLESGEIISSAGFGWSVLEKNGIPYTWQSGSYGGYTNFVLRFPATQTTILVLTNSSDIKALLHLSIRIAKLYNKELLLKFR